MPRPLPADAPLLLAVPLAVLLAGCTSSGTGADASRPPAGAFADGTCRVIAEDVLDVGSQLRLLGEGPSVDQPVLDALRLRQDRLRALAERPEPSVAEQLDELVLSLGLVRSRASGGTYDAALTGNLQRSYDELVAACTGRSSS